MDRQQFLSAYKHLILDKKGRVNACLSRSKIFPEIKDHVMQLTSNFPDSITISDRIICILNNIESWPKCEVCGNPVKLSSTNKFTPFCSFKCSRTPGSSTYTKAQKTCLAKYGVKSNLVTKEAIERKRNLGGIGAQNPIIREKIRQTTLKKFGCENVFQNEKIKEKIKKTHQEKYGGNYHTMKLGKKLQLLNDKQYCIDIAKRYCLSTICEMLGVSSNTVYKYFEQHGITSFNSQRSNQETELLNYITSLTSCKVISGDRKQLNGLEIDIFIPEKNLGIEMHGLYWHSEKAGISPSYHLKKYEMARKKGIRLIQIFENEWVLKQEIVKSKIASLLGVTNKIPARKCSAQIISRKEAQDFLSSNHLQGACASSINIGLFFNEELVACMTFSKTRFDKSADYEMTRFCNKLHCTVVGGFQKLLKFFIKKFGNNSIVSYADRRWSNGGVYEKAGFKCVSSSNPAYHYFLRSSLVLENRMKYQKHKLPKILPTFDERLSEWENMKAAGYNRIWDCGTTKWVLSK